MGYGSSRELRNKASAAEYHDAISSVKPIRWMHSSSEDSSRSEPTQRCMSSHSAPAQTKCTSSRSCVICRAVCKNRSNPLRRSAYPAFNTTLSFGPIPSSRRQRFLACSSKLTGAYVPCGRNVTSARGCNTPCSRATSKNPSRTISDGNTTRDAERAIEAT